MVKFDASPEGRNRFLRKVHRQPLQQRMFEMFGNRGAPMLATLDRLLNYEGNRVGYEETVRNIIRHCKKITGKDADSRRRQYVQTCVDHLEAARHDPTAEEIELDQADPVQILASAAEIGVKEARTLCYRLLHAMLWRLDQRKYRDGGGEALGDRAAAIVKKAARKKYPIRYLQVVTLNEHVARRQQEERK